MPIPPCEVVSDLVISILLPGFVVSFVSGLILLRWKWAALALVLGFFASNVINTPLPWFDWDQELGRVCLILVLSLATLFQDDSKTWKLVAGAAWVGGLCCVLCFHENIEISHRLIIVAVSMVQYLLLRYGETRLSNWVLPALLASSGLATALVMLQAHTARLSEVGMMWMASSIGLLVASCITKYGIRGLAGPAAVSLPFLLYYGRISTYSEVPVWSFVLVAAAPLACILCWLGKTKLRITLVVALWLLCLIAAVTLAIRYETTLAG